MITWLLLDGHGPKGKEGARCHVLAAPLKHVVPFLGIYTFFQEVVLKQNIAIAYRPNATTIPVADLRS
jgi:hypothetical protein